jgi:excinuclease UvrABC nuclease subunit
MLRSRCFFQRGEVGLGRRLRPTGSPLPHIESFYSRLADSSISTADYQHAQLFEKGTYGWRPGIYTIYKIKGNYPRAHYVKDSDGKKLKQHYMGYQLQKVEGDEVSPDYDAAAVAKANTASKARSKASKTIRKLNKEGIDPEAKVKKKKLRKRKGNSVSSRVFP